MSTELDIRIEFNDPEQKALCQRLESWLSEICEDGVERGDLIGLLTTYCLFEAYSGGDTEEIDEGIAHIRDRVLSELNEETEKLIH